MKWTEFLYQLHGSDPLNGQIHCIDQVGNLFIGATYQGVIERSCIDAASGA
jgi:hypothetical protein